MTVKQVKFADYQDEITNMMMCMLHLEPQLVDIPVKQYIELDESGIVKPILWFDGNTVKGVALLFVSSSLRNPNILDAQTDVLWVKPEHRGNSNVFIDGIKKLLAEMGVSYWMASSRDKKPINKFLVKNNFRPLERVFYCEV